MPFWLTPLLAKLAEYRHYVIVGVLCLFIGGCVGCTVEGWKRDIFGGGGAETRSFGWKDDPAQVATITSTFPRQFFGDAGKGLIEADENKDAFLWKAYEKVTGHAWRAHDQNGTGCCVGEGFSGALEILTCVEIAMHGDAQEYKDISASAVYALSREVGGMLGGGDGSTGASAAKALLDFGAVSCEEAGDDNTTGKPHGAIAKKWGGRGGLPSELKAIAAKHKIKTASMVRTPEEVRAALVNGYPVAICSGVGFEPFRRDNDGFCRPGGTWPHCMFIAGYRADRKAFLVIQSWGENSPPGPKSLDQPNCSFWITWEACQRIVRSGESYALSTFEGYPSRKLDWLIQAAPIDRRQFATVTPLAREVEPARRLIDFPLAQ